MSDNKNETLDDLMAAYLSGHAVKQQVEELEQLIIEDEQVRETFLKHARVEAALSSSGMPALVPLEKPRKSIHRTFIAMAALITILAISTAIFFQGQDGVTATVLSSNGDAATTFTPGRSIKIDHLVLAGGDVELELDSGVVLDIEGPAETRFTSSNQVSLISGSIVANVGENGKGFVVKTPNTRIVDLGTRFGVSLRNKGDTDVVVLDGDVEIYKPHIKNTNNELLATLTGGDAIRVDSKYVTRRLAAVALNGKSLAILDGDSSKNSVVTDVSDSIREADFRRFYSILPSGMAAGARAYSTLGKPRWEAFPDQEFPAELTGADVVGTFALDRFDRTLKLSIQIASPATVYVMMDTRSEHPDWLLRDFVKTTHQLRCGPWAPSIVTADLPVSADGEKYVDFEVWSRDMLQAGTIVLGRSSNNSNTINNLAMYGIAVKKK